MQSFPGLSHPAIAGTARRSLDLHGIYEISKILCRPDSLPRILKSTLGVLDSFLDMSTGLVVLLSENGEPELVIGGRLARDEARQCFDAIPERAIGQVVVGGVPLVVPDVAQDDVFGPWNTTLWGPADRHFTFIAVPIQERERSIGALIVARDWLDHPTMALDEDISFLKMAANLMGQTVRLHRVLARDRERLMEEQRRVEKVLEQSVAPPPPVVSGEGGIIGNSAAIRAVVEKVRIAARRDVTVLLRGESGTGKELFARALHDYSSRRTAAFISLNCAALPESVLESELFGHEKGAFTGALALRKGRFELADGGTLFLDEIGEISAAFQAKLLRVLQEGEFERVGGSRTLKVNVRLVAATNRNLEEAVAKGSFRADLYYRINVVPILLPPLRDRPGDIPQLANEFLTRFNRENGTAIVLDRSAFKVLTECAFPGNVRELENCIRRTATLATGQTISDASFACRNDGCLSALLWRPSAVVPPASGPAPQPAAMRAPPAPPAPAMPLPIMPVAPAACENAENCAVAGGGKGEREKLIEAMERCGWVQAKAARLLDMTPRQIGYALRKHNISIRKL